MRKITLLCASLAAMLALALPATPAQATFFTTFVSGTGSDSGNNCGNPATPCGSFNNALANTASGGEIICVGGGPVGIQFTIAQSVTIDCGGGVGLSGGQINVNGPGIVVKLRNLTINGHSLDFGAGNTFGINATNMAALFIENCQVLGYTGNTPGIGIKFAPAGVTAKLHVSDSVITGNGLAASGGGIIIQPAGSGSARVVIERTRVEGNTYGIFANGMGSTGLIAVQVKDSVVANNAFNGISAFTAAGQSTTSITVDRSSSLLNGADGILAQGPPGFVILGNSTVMSNVTGLHSVDGGSIFSYQDNHLTGNVTDGAPTGMLALK